MKQDVSKLGLAMRRAVRMEWTSGQTCLCSQLNTTPRALADLRIFRDSVLMGRGAGPGHPLADANAAAIVLQKRVCSARFRLDN